jgi:hypothetical protein
MTCSQCGTVNPRGSLFCNICFSPIGTVGQGGGLPSPVKISAPDVLNNIIPRLIIIENTQPTGQSITLPKPPYTSEILIGRNDLKKGIIVDIDVSIYGGHDKGVSRKHAKISFSNNNFFIGDWESNLGTFVNKEKLPSGVQKIIKNNDEIRLANLTARFEV